MNPPPDTWASEMQALQDLIEQMGLELDCARRNENNVNYWYGQDDGVRGAAGRWEEALTCPIPKAGSMQEPLESLYRRTEALRQERDTAVSDLALALGRCDGYLYLLHAAMAVIEKHWAPHDPVSSNARDELLERFGASANAAWEAVAAGLRR